MGSTTHVPDRDGPIDFGFDSLDDRPVSSLATRGKPLVLSFIATWDLSSQAQVDFLVPFAKKEPSATFALVALQEDKDRALVDAFCSQLKVEFPVAMGDSESIAGRGPFGDVHEIPTTIILDRAGRIVWRHVGLTRPADIREKLAGL